MKKLFNLLLDEAIFLLTLAIMCGSGWLLISMLLESVD